MEKLYLCNMEDRKLLNIELGRISADEYRRRPESGIVVVLDNIRSAHNVGSAFRTSDAFGVDKIYLGGICPVPPSPELHKVALGAEEVVPFEHVADVVDLVHRLREEGYTVIAVEQTVNSVKLDEFRPEGGTDSAGHRPFSCPAESVLLPKAKYALIFGNEVSGVQQEAVNPAHFALEIPQRGTKHSLNVSVSIGVVLWGLVQAVNR